MLIVTARRPRSIRSVSSRTASTSDSGRPARSSQGTGSPTTAAHGDRNVCFSRATIPTGTIGKRRPLRSRRTEGDARGAGAKPRQRGFRMTQAFGKDPDRVSRGQRLVHGLEHARVAVGERWIVLPPVHGDGASGPHQRTETGFIEQRRLGQEPDGPTHRGRHDDRIHDRVRVVGDEQDRTFRRRRAVRLESIEHANRRRA